MGFGHELMPRQAVAVVDEILPFASRYRQTSNTCDVADIHRPDRGGRWLLRAFGCRVWLKCVPAEAAFADESHTGEGGAVAMGWWLFSKKRPGGKRKSLRSLRRKSHGPSPEWDPHRTLMALKVLGVIAVMVGTVAAWYWGRQALLGYVQRHSVGAVSAQDVKLVDAPTWMSQFVAAELCQTMAAEATGNRFSRQSLERMSAVAAANPWVRAVRWVRRSGREIWLSAEYRRPLALVESGGDYLLIDDQGFRLPGQYTQSQTRAVGLPVMLSVKSSPPPPGQPWTGDDIKAGVKVLTLVRGQPFARQVKALQLRDADGHIRPVLLTGDNGGMVFWGRPPGEEQPVEVDASVKLSRLASVYEQRGSIDAGGKQVYIYGPAVFVGPETAAVDRGVDYTW